MWMKKFIRVLKCFKAYAKVAFKDIICKPWKISLGKNDELKTLKDGSITINNFLNCANNVSLVSEGKMEINGASFNRYDIVVCKNCIKIGNNCRFGPNVAIYDHDHEFNKDGVIPGEMRVGTVVIEDNVWIGANCVILRNTHIGKNCIIGAGCVVSGAIPDNSLVTMNRELNVRPLHD